MRSIKVLNLMVGLLFGFIASAMITTAVGIPAEIGVPVLMVLGTVGATLASKMGVAFTLISGTPITFNGKEARDGIVEPAFAIPELSEFLTVQEDIVAKEQIAYLGRLSKVTIADAGCGTGITNKTVPMAEKFWNPNKVKVWLQQCADDLETTFFVWGLQKGIKRKDLTPTDFIDFVMDILTDAVKEDALRFIWFGDTSADTIGMGSFLNDIADQPYYDVMDGLWKQFFDAVTATTMKRVTIAVNANATYATQALGASDAYDTFKAMIEQADGRLKAEKNKMIICSQSMFDNWLSYKESKQIDSSFVRQDKDFSSDIFRGIPIYSMPFWDRQIDTDMNNGTKWVDPHRAILTTKANLVVGVDASAGITDFDVFLDKVTEQNNMKGGYKLDAKVIHEFMTIVAY